MARQPSEGALLAVLSAAETMRLTDRELLARFSQGDQTAFAAIVKRHTGLVLGVCRRMLPTLQDAEDACQATFLVLARKAKTIRWQSSIANWLFTTARRVASKAARAAAQRMKRESLSAPPPAVSALDQITLREGFVVLDEELDKLPTIYREPLVLCYLQGLTRDEAAIRLGIPSTTLKSQLDRGRKKLADALTKRGIDIGAGLIAIAATSSSGAFSPRLVESILATVSGSPSASVAAIAKGIAMNGFSLKAKVLVLVVVAVAVSGFGIASKLLNRPPAAETKREQGFAIEEEKVKAPNPQPPAKDAINPKSAGRILVYRKGKFIVVAPDGQQLDELPRHPDKIFLEDPAISPDGKRAAFIAPYQPPDERHIVIRELNGKEKQIDIDIDIAIEAANIAWTPEGKLLAAEALRVKDSKDLTFATWIADVDTQQKKRLELPNTIQVFGLGPDGKSYIGVAFDFAEHKGHLALVGPDGKITKLTEIDWAIPWSPVKRTNPKLSPDGTRILFQDFDAAEKKQEGLPRFSRLFVYDLKTGKRELLADQPPKGRLIDHSWSPDSQRVAYVWKGLEPGVPIVLNTKNLDDPKLRTELEAHLTVADADGKNAKTLFSEKRNAAAITIGTFDWR